MMETDCQQSQCRKALVDGEKYKPFDGGQSAFRFLVPKKDLMADERCRQYVEEEGYLGMVVGPDRRIVYYPCVNNTLMNFLMIHPSSESRSDDAGKIDL